ncbi:MAG: hypothetical protein Q9162_003109 [Coniocarpon cinnabarinum]
MFKNHPRTPASNRKPKTSPPGTFKNKTWYCACRPPLPAEHFRVKKEGKNKGRWFWTCQRDSEERCGFFLWGEEAERQMKGLLMVEGQAGNDVGRAGGAGGAVVSAGVDAPAGAGAGAGVRREEEAPRINGETTQKKPRKRKLPWKTDNDVSKSKSSAAQKQSIYDASTTDESFNMSEDEEVALSQATATAGRLKNSPETPRKAQKTTAVQTPSSKTSMNANFETPLKKSANGTNGLITPGTTPHQDKSLQRTEPETPTPLRVRDAVSESLTSRTMQLLRDHAVAMSPAAERELRSLLDSESRKAEGIRKGRDAAREAVTKRDERIARLVGRVRELEGMAGGRDTRSKTSGRYV